MQIKVAPVEIDLHKKVLFLGGLSLTLRFDTDSRYFYLLLIALIAQEMAIQASPSDQIPFVAFEDISTRLTAMAIRSRVKFETVNSMAKTIYQAWTKRFDPALKGSRKYEASRALNPSEELQIQNFFQSEGSGLRMRLRLGVPPADIKILGAEVLSDFQNRPSQEPAVQVASRYSPNWLQLPLMGVVSVLFLVIVFLAIGREPHTPQESLLTPTSLQSTQATNGMSLFRSNSPFPYGFEIIKPGMLLSAVKQYYPTQAGESDPAGSYVVDMALGPFKCARFVPTATDVDSSIGEVILETIGRELPESVRKDLQDALGTTGAQHVGHDAVEWDYVQGYYVRLERTCIRIRRAPSVSRIPECADGIDNDGDGLVDFPFDKNCRDFLDNGEMPECNDGIDNDGDRKIDWPLDPGCNNPGDDSERNP